ncbi:MAG TPA: DUF192 domain-containing protein [Spirochaetota bacterium]|nr:DUF192 domain-containing protein [Spirochaetota bacterium]HPS85430.1 DUF192 domain-containing protein [Spirochaetota bacterium]
MGSFRNSCLTAFFIFIFVAVFAAPLNKKCLIYLHSGNGTRIKLNAEIADSDSEREKGLMYRESLNENEGMLFVFEREKKLNFWMKNTLIPLDIAYIDRNGIINEIYHMKPLDVSVTYNSIKPAMFALEVNLGWFSRHKIKTGTKIEFNGCLSKPNSFIER